MSPPIRIGITTSFEKEEQKLHRTYVLALERAGALPLIVPMLETDEALEAFVDLLDGLVITGGPAVTTGLVGDLPDDIDETDPIRVASDRRILRAFLDRRKPVLGICYGMQFLNAEAGGTIYADVQRQREGVGVHSSVRGGTEHEIGLEEGSHLRRVLGSGRLRVNTRHIQAVASVGPPFRIAATAPDGVVEAIENEDGSVLGVQFHPERMGEEVQALFTHLIERARERRGSSP